MATKRSGSSSSSVDDRNGGFPPPPDLCAHPGCLLWCNIRPSTTSDGRNNSHIDGSYAVPGRSDGGVVALSSNAVTTSPDAGGGGGDAAAGHGLVEVLAAKGAERRRCEIVAQEEASRGRWPCKSDKCREIHNSYHRRCLENRSIPAAAAAWDAAVADPKHGGEEKGLEKSGDLVCPACCSIVATHQQVVSAQQG